MFVNQSVRTASEINTGMSRVYLFMMTAVLNSMLVSYVVGSHAELSKFFLTGIMHWVVLLLPLAAIFVIAPLLESDAPASVSLSALHVFASLMGLSMSAIFVTYTATSIFTAFLGASVLFAVMSCWGYFTRRSLDNIGDLCFVALIAIIVASVVNMFIGSSAFQMFISAVAIVVFLAFTAYDTQKIRERLSEDTRVSTEVSSALTLYLDFINLFLNLLQLFGASDD